MTASIRTVKNVIHELASQTYVLATSLQNVAPPQQTSKGPGKSVQYLLETAVRLEKISEEIGELLIK